MSVPAPRSGTRCSREGQRVPAAYYDQTCRTYRCFECRARMRLAPNGAVAYVHEADPR